MDESDKQRRPLPVVFALHDAKGTYWLNTAVALTSVAQHAKGPIHIHVLHDESLGETARRRLAEIAAWLETPLTLREVAPPPGLPERFYRQFSPACVFRLMIPELFRGEEAVVYLDSDLVSNGVDVGEIAAAAPADAPISAALDPYIARMPQHVDSMRAMGLDPAAYINSGVLAVRPALIPEDLVAACLEFSLTQPASLHADQDFLNHHFAGRIGRLDGRFNTHLGLFDQGMVQPLSHFAGRILHYAGQLKPLDGCLGPGSIPFLAHAYLVPEVVQGRMYEVAGYLLPQGDSQHTLGLKPLRPQRPPQGA